MKMSKYRPYFGARGRAQQALRNRDPATAIAELEAANNLLQQEVVTLKAQYDAARAQQAAGGLRGVAAARTASQCRAHGQALVKEQQKIRNALDALGGQGAPLASPGQQPRPGSGRIQAPAGAGMFLRVPFESIGDTALAAGLSFELLSPAAFAGIRMRTPQLSFLRYRIHSIKIERQSDAGGAGDFVNVQNLVAQGSPNLIRSQGPVAVESFRMGDSHTLGLRKKIEVTSPNFLEITLNSNQPAGAAPAGNTVIYASAVIEVLWDDTYGDINAWNKRREISRYTGATGSGYVFPDGPPGAGKLERISMRVETEEGAAPALNNLNQVGFTLTADVNTIGLRSEQIRYANCQIVGFEVATPDKAVVTDVVTVEDLQTDGGATLFAQPDDIPAINFLGDEAGRGGGAHTFIGLRNYPKLSDTNQCAVTVQAFNGLTGAQGMAGASINMHYVNLIVDVLDDQIFGPGTDSPYAADKALLALGG